MFEQGAFTAVVEIEPQRVAELDALLRRIGDAVGGAGCPIPFETLTTVHFMRWVVLDPGTDAKGRPLPAQLVLSTNYDLPLAAHLDELVAVGGPTLHAIYDHCVGFRAGGNLLGYLRSHAIDYAAFYVGTKGRTVADVRAERALRDRVQDYLDRNPPKPGATASEIHAAVRAHVEPLARAVGRPDLADWSRGRVLKRVLAGVVPVAAAVWAASVAVLGWAAWWYLPAAALALAVVSAVGLVLWLVVLNACERWLDPHVRITHPIGVPALASREDFLVQNQLTALINVKPQWFRLVTMRAFLAAVNLAGRYFFVRGELGGIPTIHFARWVVLDRGRRLLFMSNFDGSWENYLGDFIDKASPGLTGIWSNTVGCPEARWLVQRGARDEPRFKAWVRENQLVTQVWYSAYPELTVSNVNTNSKIRDGLARDLTPAEAAAWATLL